MPVVVAVVQVIHGATDDELCGFECASCIGAEGPEACSQIMQGGDRKDISRLCHSASLPLAEIIAQALGFSKQEGDLFIGGTPEVLQDAHGLLEFFGELLVFLVAPSVAQGDKLRLQPLHTLAQLRIELLELGARNALVPPDYRPPVEPCGNPPARLRLCVVNLVR